MVYQGRKIKMMDKTKGLKKYAQEKTQLSIDKVDKAIRELSLSDKKINFNSVSELSGVSKTFLYKNEDIKGRIETLRNQQVNKAMNQKIKTDKTNKSKDIIIMAKDKKIKELENENKKLKEQIEILRGKLYEKM